MVLATSLASERTLEEFGKKFQEGSRAIEDGGNEVYVFHGWFSFVDSNSVVHKPCYGHASAPLAIALPCVPLVAISERAPCYGDATTDLAPGQTGCFSPSCRGGRGVSSLFGKVIPRVTRVL